MLHLAVDQRTKAGRAQRDRPSLNKQNALELIRSRRGMTSPGMARPISPGKRSETLSEIKTEQAAIEFPSDDELDKAIDLFWNDDTYADMPRWHVGRCTIVIPSRFVGYLHNAGLRFRPFPVGTRE